MLLLFGTKKLRGLGGDLGSALKGFKKAISDDDKDEDADFAAKEKVENKSTTAEKATQNTTSEQKERN